MSLSQIGNDMRIGKMSIPAIVVVSVLLAGCGLLPSRAHSASPSHPAARPIPRPDYTISACGVRATTGQSNVLLTIDDYPDNVGTSHGEVMVQVADWAHQAGVMMEAFPIKQKVDAWQKQTGTDLVAELRARGTYVSNHTYTHPRLPKLSPKEITKEITQGVTSTYLRPPYGEYTLPIKQQAEKLGYRTCTWNIDTNDWRLLPNGAFPSPAELVRRVHEQLLGIPDGTPVVILGHYFTNYPKALAAIAAEVTKMHNHLCPAPQSATTMVVPYPIC